MSKITKVDLQQMDLLAGQIVGSVKPGLILGLVGDLGAGKTTFVQLLAKHLGITERVTSPTFNLQKLYELPMSINGIERLLHVDAYRLKSILELEDIGFFEYLTDDKTLAVVEWANQIPELLDNQNYLPILFTGIDNHDCREIELPSQLLI